MLTQPSTQPSAQHAKLHYRSTVYIGESSESDLVHVNMLESRVSNTEKQHVVLQLTELYVS